MKTFPSLRHKQSWLRPMIIAALSALLLSSCETARYLFGERSASEKPDYLYYDDEYYPDRFDDD